jgi:hypothetical protein
MTRIQNSEARIHKGSPTPAAPNSEFLILDSEFYLKIEARFENTRWDTGQRSI